MAYLFPHEKTHRWPRLLMGSAVALGLSMIAFLPNVVAPAQTALAADPVLRIVPTPYSPVDGTKVATLGPTLRWNQEPGTNWFQVQVIPFHDDGPGINMIIGDPGLVAAGEYRILQPDFGATDPNYVMLPDMTYTWRVRTAMTSDPPLQADWTVWSDFHVFETANRSSVAIDRLTPDVGATVESLTPTLAWTNGDKTIFYYELQLSKDPSFITDPAAAVAPVYWELIHGGMTSPLNSYAVHSEFALDAGTTYYWHVRPRVQGDGAALEWSTMWSFMTP